MCWECSECGGHVMRHRPPIVCPECGTAGATFVEADPELQEEGEHSFGRASWLRRGLESDAFLYSQDQGRAF